MTPLERQNNIRNATRNRVRYFYELVTKDLLTLDVPKTKTKYKIAILLSGGLRNFSITQEWMNKFLIEPLNADVFVHGWCSKSGIEEDIKTTQNYINIKSFKVLDRSKVTIPVPDVMKDKYPDHISRGWGMEVADHVLGQLYNIKSCFDLIDGFQKENSVQYDIIIRCRPDEFWFDKIQDEDLEAVFKNKCLATPQNYISVISGGHINDRFAMGSYDVIKRYCDMFLYVKDYAKLAGNDEATEFYVDYHIRNTMKDIYIHNIDATFMLEYPGDYPLEKGFNPTNMRHLEQNDSNIAIAEAKKLKSYE